MTLLYLLLKMGDYGECEGEIACRKQHGEENGVSGSHSVAHDVPRGDRRRQDMRGPNNNRE